MTHFLFMREDFPRIVRKFLYLLSVGSSTVHRFPTSSMTKIKVAPIMFPHSLNTCLDPSSASMAS